MTGSRVSVVIPTYNRAALVARAVDSALRACEPGDEVLVVDDGSTDDTALALRRFGDRMRHVVAPHRGAGATRNRGVAEARAPLIAFLDSDDEWVADHLAIHRAVHDARPDVAFSFSDFGVRERDGSFHRRYLANWHGDPRPWTEILAPPVDLAALSPSTSVEGDAPVHIGDLRLQEMLADYVPTFTTVAKRAALPDATWFAEDVPTFEDLQCFGRLTGAGLAAFVDRETAVQYGHAGPRLTGVPDLQKAESRLKVLDRVWGGDLPFLERHGAAYRERVREQHVLRARCYLKEGRSVEARAALRAAGRAPWTYRALSWLPGTATRTIIGVASRLRG